MFSDISELNKFNVLIMDLYLCLEALALGFFVVVVVEDLRFKNLFRERKRGSV